MSPRLEKLFEGMPIGSAVIAVANGCGESLWRMPMDRPALSGIAIAIMTKTLESLRQSIASRLSPEQLAEFNDGYQMVMNATPDEQIVRVEEEKRAKPPESEEGRPL